MSAQQFMEMLFGKLPEFFKDEAELRALWSAPDTRKKLLQGLAESGFGGEQLAEMRKIIDAEKSDLFDVLAHVAYASPPLPREDRAAKAQVEITCGAPLFDPLRCFRFGWGFGAVGPQNSIRTYRERVWSGRRDSNPRHPAWKEAPPSGK